MLKTLVILASIANCAGGLVLIFTWATMSQRVPIIVLFIGVSLLIQGGFTILYLRGDLDSWGNIATGALFAGEGLSACVGAGGLIQGIIHNINNADMEMAPVLAGLLMLVQALLALLYLFLSGRLRPRVNGRSSA
jgi:formate-dependent nitrite reductase membrane component NrfD